MQFMAPWVVPLGIITSCIFLMGAILVHEKNGNLDSDAVAYSMICLLAIIIGCVGSVITIWIL